MTMTADELGGHLEEKKSRVGTTNAAMTAEEVRKKFNLNFNEDHSKLSGPEYSKGTGGDGFTNDGAIFTEHGEYVGSIDADGDKDYYAGFSNLTNAASDIKQKSEGKGFTNVNSLSDVAGAVHWLTKGDKEEEEKEPEKPEEPYVQSEKLSKAKAGVKAYEEAILPNTGDIITGKNKDYKLDFLNNYKLNLAKEMKPRNPDGTTRDSTIQDEKDAEEEESTLNPGQA